MNRQPRPSQYEPIDPLTLPGVAGGIAPTITVEHVSKWYGDVVAVSDVSFGVTPGVTGLLGPNGAGKSTLLKMIAGLISTSTGGIKIDGLPARGKPAAYRRIGLVPEQEELYPHLTGREFVRLNAILQKLPDLDVATERALDLVDMHEAADRSLGGYSKGMRQRIKVAAALVHDPDVLLMDEPLNGTDPVQRARLIKLFRALGDEGRTVIVSSHILQEVERMTDRVIAMVDGKLAAAGDIAAIRAAMAHIPYRVVVDASDVRKLGSALIRHDDISGVRIENGRLHVETTSLRILGTEVPAVAKGIGVRLTGFRPEDDSLESVFRYLVSKR